jgi:serine phosphatase RsbU (regulator of sigma subunit)
LLSRLNRALRSTLEYSEVPLFDSAFYLLADLEKGEIRYANAGHPNPLRVHCAPERSETHSLNGSKHGPALGTAAHRPPLHFQSVTNPLSAFGAN